MLSQRIFKWFSKLGDKVTTSVMSNYTNFRERKFVDQVKVKFQAGNGGNGCVSHFRDRNVLTGAPDGGDGGKGGDILLKASHHFTDLHIFKGKPIFGNNGKSGGGLGKFGKDGGDLHISVPVGTLIYEILSESQSINQAGIRKIQYNKKFLTDLDEEGKEILIVKGGKGGRGNQNHRSIREQEKGSLGQVKEIFMELKCIADCGLVGFPNAGKSTFLASVSRSLPKIANYPFTTLTPLVGKVKFVDNSAFTIADIPGIIEESHQNKGLGLEFLRHIERTHVLIFMLDISGSHNEQPWKNFEILKNELLQYRSDFLDKPYILVANKTDIEPDSQRRVKELEQRVGKKVFEISAKHGLGIGEVILELRRILQEMGKIVYY
ncbi:hypothetical protein ABPG72_015712 [Tetrahymena utriculariae]